MINLILSLPSLNQQIAMWLNNQTDLYTYLHMGIGSDAVLYDILVGFNSGMVRQALIDANGYTAIYTWYYLNNPQQVLQYGAKHAHGLVSTWQTAQAPHGMAAYFGFVQQYYGQTAYDFMLQLYQSASKTYLDSFNLSEWHIYGSARLGIYQTYLNLVTAKFNANTGSGGAFTEVGYGSAVFASVNYQLFSLQRGEKVYELTNHLGNVLLTVSDKRLPQCSATVLTGHTAYVISATDYSAFGAPLPGRTWNADGYRFGFNGQEKDDEIAGAGISYAFSSRVHDSRLGRFLSVDPLTKSFVWNSPYAFAENRLIDGHELEGKEWERRIEYDILSGQFDVRLTVKVQVVNSSKITNDIEANSLMSAMQNQIAVTFTQQDKDRGINYSTALEYTFVNRRESSIVSADYNKSAAPFMLQFKDVNSEPDGSVETGSTVARPIGTTQNNRMIAATTIDGEKRSATDIARTGTHEVGGHSGGLEHPWAIKSGQHDIRVGVASPELILNNIMNTEAPESPNPSVRGVQSTPDQLLHITKTIGNDKK